jgi:hypothetical protein
MTEIFSVYLTTINENVQMVLTPVAKSIVPAGGLKFTPASGCHLGPPGYIGWQAYKTTLYAGVNYPPFRALFTWLQVISNKGKDSKLFVLTHISYSEFKMFKLLLCIPQSISNMKYLTYS